MPETDEQIRAGPLTAVIRSISNGGFLRFIFLGMLALSVGTVGYDFQQLIANAPLGQPGSQTLEPTPMELPVPGDQTRPYLPKTMPLGPGRQKPDLPGYFGPLDGTVLSAPMQFVRGEEDKVSAIGTIDPGASDRLEAFLEDNNKQIGEIVLHSPGGSVADALLMAQAIRDAGISTRVAADGYCASSCPLLLAGGLYRRAGPRAYIGVHQVFALPSAVGTLQRGMADAQAISALCQRLLVNMGVDAKAWIFAMSTPPQDLYLFTPEQLREFRLANHRRPVTQPKPRPLAEG